MQAGVSANNVCRNISGRRLLLPAARRKLGPFLWMNLRIAGGGHPPPACRMVTLDSARPGLRRFAFNGKRETPRPWGALKRAAPPAHGFNGLTTKDGPVATYRTTHDAAPCRRLVRP